MATRWSTRQRVAVSLGPQEPSSPINYIDDTDAATDGDASLLIRDMLGNWAEGTGNVGVHCVSDCPAFFFMPSSEINSSADFVHSAINWSTDVTGASHYDVDELVVEHAIQRLRRDYSKLLTRKVRRSARLRG